MAVYAFDAKHFLLEFSLASLMNCSDSELLFNRRFCSVTIYEDHSSMRLVPLKTPEQS